MSAKTMEEAGASITVTSLTNGLSFGVGGLANTPAIRLFCIYAAVGVLIDFIYQVYLLTYKLSSFPSMKSHFLCDFANFPRLRLVVQPSATCKKYQVHLVTLCKCRIMATFYLLICTCLYLSLHLSKLEITEAGNMIVDGKTHASGIDFLVVDMFWHVTLTCFEAWLTLTWKYFQKELGSSQRWRYRTLGWTEWSQLTLF